MSEAKPQVIVKIKRKGGHGGHHGGAWKVAYADFVTAMMALFIVLWLLTQADLELRQSIARYFRNASVLSGGSMLGEEASPAKTQDKRPLDAALSIVQGTGDDMEALRGHARRIERALQQSPEFQQIKEQVQIAVTKEGLEIQVIDSGATGRKDLLFELASAELKPELVKFLRTLAKQLGKLPNRIRIGGHTDALPFAAASDLTNWDLAFARANNARKVMEGSGLGPNQVLSLVAYADMKPLIPDNPLAAENRRLSILALRQPSGDDQQSDHAAEDTALRDAAQEAAPAFSPRFAIPGLPPN
jgi:chemotaxis protein MotB